MNEKTDQPAEGLGLLAHGSSQRWDIAVDQSLDRDEWSLEIDGPQAYLVFQLRDLEVIREALRFLKSGPPLNRGKGRRQGGEERALHLGRFGSASVSLLWDNEDFVRCFLVIGPKARSTLRLSLEERDVQMFTEALQQVLNDISPNPNE
jgi:hypothetical protein